MPPFSNFGAVYFGYKLIESARYGQSFYQFDPVLLLFDSRAMYLNATAALAKIIARI